MPTAAAGGDRYLGAPVLVNNNFRCYLLFFFCAGAGAPHFVHGRFWVQGLGFRHSQKHFSIVAFGFRVQGLGILKSLSLPSLYIVDIHRKSLFT